MRTGILQQTDEFLADPAFAYDRPQFLHRILHVTMVSELPCVHKHSAPTREHCSNTLLVRLHPFTCSNTSLPTPVPAAFRPHLDERNRMCPLLAYMTEHHPHAAACYVNTACCMQQFRTNYNVCGKRHPRNETGRPLQQSVVRLLEYPLRILSSTAVDPLCAGMCRCLQTLWCLATTSSTSSLKSFGCGEVKRIRMFGSTCATLQRCERT